MKTSNVLVLISVLLFINVSTEWPTHTVCKEDNLEIYYKSCGEIFKIYILFSAGQQICSYAVRDACKTGNPKPALGFEARIFLAFPI